jgi:hypothetical protein
MCENESAVAKIEPVSTKLDRHPQQISSTFEPKTPIGRRLWSIRKRIVASGETLFGWNEIGKEVAARRGEAD